jgi:hypothetical protein
MCGAQTCGFDVRVEVVFQLLFYLLRDFSIRTADSSVHIRGVSKKFGEWYQKTNRRCKQVYFIGLQNNRHPSQHNVGNVHKASGNGQQRPL